MMDLKAIIDQLNLTVLTAPKPFEQEVPMNGYTSDLLSCVMAGAKNKGLWVTLQAHMNIVAVAALLELSAVIITEGAMPDSATIAKANEQGVTLLATKEPSFEVVGRLWELGLRS
jgi:imidazolonepropionase-like amidohydrolase